VATLLTGLGYIGAALVRRLVRDRGERVVALENFYSTPREAVARALPEGVELIEGDVADQQAVARLFDALEATGETARVLFHLAAQPSAAMAVRDPATTERANLSGARIVLEAAAERRTPVVFGSSFRVYGDDLAGQSVDEQTPYGPVGDLSHLSKIYVEHLARMLRIRFASVRLGVTYGLSPIMKTTPAFMTVPNLFCQRAACGEVLQVLEDRPMAFIHVEDAAAALLAAADRLARPPRRPTQPRATATTAAPQVDAAEAIFEPLNAAPEVASIGQVARTVQRLAQARGRWVRIHGVAAEGAGCTFEVRSKLADDGFLPTHSLAADLGEVLDFFVRTA
jgi:nucleoside-diphosphate-sugar epimerase